MQQSIHSSQVDEGAVIGKAPHRAAHRLALLDLRIKLVLGGALFFLRHGAPVDHDILIRDVELDDAAANLLPHQLLHLGRFANAAARSRHERPHPHVDAEPAFDYGRHRAQNGGFVGKRFFQAPSNPWAVQL